MVLNGTWKYDFTPDAICDKNYSNDQRSRYLHGRGRLRTKVEPALPVMHTYKHTYTWNRPVLAWTGSMRSIVSLESKLSQPRPHEHMQSLRHCLCVLLIQGSVKLLASLLLWANFARTQFLMTWYRVLETNMPVLRPAGSCPSVRGGSNYTVPATIGIVHGTGLIRPTKLNNGYRNVTPGSLVVE